jgi:hypothetical protein
VKSAVASLLIGAGNSYRNMEKDEGRRMKDEQNAIPESEF